MENSFRDRKGRFVKGRVLPPDIEEKRLRRLRQSMKPKYRNVLTKEFLEQKYVKEEMSTRKIARIVGCDKATVIAYLRKYGIPLRSNAYARHLSRKRNFDLTKDVKEYIDGLLLGDGHIYQKSKWSARYDQSLSIRFKEWADKIQQDLLRFGIESSTLIYETPVTIIKKTGQVLGPSKMIMLFTRFYEEFVVFKERWYKDGFKSVPRDLELTPLVLANWYMGDGDYDRHTKRVTLNVNSFSLDDVNFLIRKLREMGFKAKNHPKTNQDNQPRIRLTPESSRRFLEITEPFKVSCFDYKWGL